MNIHFYRKFFKSGEKLDDDVYHSFFTKQLILRDYLAIERTILTNDSTFLAYIRTSLTIIVVGVTLFHLYPDNTTLQYASIVLVLLGIFIFITGARTTITMRNKINEFLKKREEVEVEVLK